MHKNLIFFNVRTFAREPVRLCLCDVMSVLLIQDDGVSVFLM